MNIYYKLVQCEPKPRWVDKCWQTVQYEALDCQVCSHTQRVLHAGSPQEQTSRSCDSLHRLTTLPPPAAFSRQNARRRVHNSRHWSLSWTRSTHLQPYNHHSPSHYHLTYAQVFPLTFSTPLSTLQYVIHAQLILLNVITMQTSVEQ
jgi:hypothetical protein